uniref:Cadherin domain-containing protein n=1 Tax=Octopus bimaculoides TaxID=37653 RepID=A0A0L8FTE7_OCTBM
MLYIVLLVLLMADNCWCVDHIYHVKENKDIHSYIGDIVTDTQLLHNIQSQDKSNKLTFNVLQGSIDGAVQLFNVTPGGQLYTAAILDAEILCQYNVECFRILEIAVQHDHSFLKIIEIKVVIDDVNDNYPKFPKKEFHLKFDENDLIGTKYIIPNAIDNDVSIKNSRITYQIKDLDIPFKLFVSKNLDGSDLLQLNLENVLDRETKDMYNIQLIARDKGSPVKEGVLHIKIIIKDINDNFPVFSQNTINVTVNDTHQLNKPIAKLSATDLDEGENGLISYFFNAIISKYAVQFFRLDEVTGYLFLKKEFQFGRIYKLFVEARDNGNPPRSSTATVLVNGVSLLNNPPDIDVKFILKLTGNTAVISEGTQIHNFIAYVKVTDNDGGVNGQVKCHLQNRYLQLISLSVKKYKIVVKSEIDRESEKRFDFTIKCQDNGLPPLKVEKQFSMMVTDINDVQPQFISNNTSKIFKTPSKTTTESSNGLQLNVMTVIVIAAVILSVVIVISISICIVHGLKRTDSNYNSSVDMYHKVTPTLNIQSKYIFDPTCVHPKVQNTLERNLKKSQQPIEDRKDIHCRTMSADRWDDLTSRKQQMFIPREESISPGYRELNYTDQFSEMSTLSSHSDSGHGWSVGSAGHYEELPDLCRYQYDRTWNRRNPNFSNTFNRSSGDNHNGYHYQPNVDINTSCDHDQIPFTVTGTTSDVSEQPSTVPMTSDFSSDCKPPLPAVPKVTTLPKVPSILQVPSQSETNI